MSRFLFVAIFIVKFMYSCDSSPAYPRNSQSIQHRAPHYPEHQNLNGHHSQEISNSIGDVPFGEGNPLPYSPEIQERILEGVNDMVGDIAAEVMDTLEMLEMSKKRHRRSHSAQTQRKAGRHGDGDSDGASD
ncbi:unnamed protein product [Orchesella dallaii]|uniref:Uncharacterized protein n=1 Tax=Orchesella dallaii TaxID=48710 RepID=A0ABP1R810_9HEXA